MTLLSLLHFHTNSIISLFFFINSFILFFLIHKNKKSFLSIFKKINKKTYLIIFIIFLISLSIRITIPPHEHYIYIDEIYHLEAGKELFNFENNSFHGKSIGWSTIIAIIFKIFGLNNMHAIYTSLFIGSLIPIIIFFIVNSLTKNKKASILSALLFALFPEAIRWSTTTESNIVALFFYLISVFVMILYYKKPHYSLLWLTLLTISFSNQFRPENYSLLPVFLVGLALFRPRFLKNFKFKNIFPFIISLILTFPFLIRTLFLYNSNNWNLAETMPTHSGINWSIQNLISNSIEYSHFIFSPIDQPSIFVILLTIGIIYLYKKSKKELIFFSSIFLSYYLIYFVSWFKILGSNSRAYFHFYSITCIIAAFGIIGILKFLGQLFKNKHNFALFIFSIFIIFMLFFPYTLKAQNYYTDDYRTLETKLPELIKNDIPKNCIIVSNWAQIISATSNFKTIETPTFLKKNSTNINNSCIFYLEDIGCRMKHSSELITSCNAIKEKYQLSVHKSYSEKNITYTLYKIKK